MKDRWFAGILALGATTLLAGQALAYSAGVTSNQFPSAASGCNGCHTGGATPVVSLEGPELVDPGSVNEYTLVIETIGSQDWGGFNVQSSDGHLDTGGGDSALTQLLTNPLTSEVQVTHSATKAASLGEVRFSFLFEAPVVGGDVDIYAWGNAVNNNGSTAGDQASEATKTVSVESAGSGWNGKFNAKTKATGWKASMVRTFDASQLVDTIPDVVATWDWATPNTIQTSDCTFLAASIQSKPGKNGKFMLSGLTCPDRVSLPTSVCVEVVGISAIARFEDTKKGGEEERPCVFASTDVAGDVSQTRNVAVLCPVDAAKGSVKCDLPPVADNPCVDDKGKPTNDINTQLVDAVVYDNDSIALIDIPIGNDIAKLATCATGNNNPMGRIGTFINAK